MIVAGGTPPAVAAKKATTKIPIVVAISGDLVAAGLATSLAHPGGNVTRLTTVASDLSGKRLELVKEILPKVSWVAVLTKTTNSSHPTQVRELEIAARALHVKLQTLKVEKSEELTRVLEMAVAEHTEALIVILPEGLFTAHRQQLVDVSRKHRWVTVFYDREFADDGGLMSYGVSYADLFRRAATCVDKSSRARTQPISPLSSRRNLSWWSI